MKAEINENGVLEITAKSAVESFALRVWFDDYSRPFSDDSPEKFAALQVNVVEKGK